MTDRFGSVRLGRRTVLRMMVLTIAGLMGLGAVGPARADDTQGSFWTQFTPSSDTRLIFVSSSEGNDANSGLTPAQPVKTLTKAESLLRNGFPDWMLLKRGDSWDHMLPFWSKSGRSETEMMVVGAYGEGGQRPKILPDATASGAIRAQGNSEIGHIAFVGLHLEPRNRADDQQITGVVWLRRSRNILFEDLYIAGFKDGFSVQSLSAAAPVEDIRINGCVVVDSWSKTSHSSGLYADGVDGLVIQNSVFASNGFNLDRDAQPTIFNHNIYIQNGTSNVVVRDSVIADASSHGLQARSGGIVEGNLFLSNPLSVLLGGGTSPDDGGVSGSVSGNIFLHGRGISSTIPRSYGITASNIMQATINNNFFHSSEIGHNGDAIQIGNDRDLMLQNVRLEDNAVVDWHGSITIGNPGPSYELVGVSVVRNIIFRDLTANNGNNNFNKPMIRANDASAPGLTIANNLYRYYGMHSRPFMSADDNLTVDAWRQVYEPTGTFSPSPAAPRGFGIQNYMQDSGVGGGLEEFLAGARLMSRYNVDRRFRSSSVYDWFSTKLQQ